jgi:hypothetical protein
VTELSGVVVGTGTLVDSESVDRGAELGASLLAVAIDEGLTGTLPVGIEGVATPPVGAVSTLLRLPVVGKALDPDMGNVLDRPVGVVNVGTALLLPYRGLV